MKATIFVKENDRIMNMQYREINDCSRTTAARDLKELVDRGILKASGQRGSGSFYELITSIK
jgi:ATP-dependent DNA helicase RecG